MKKNYKNLLVAVGMAFGLNLSAQTTIPFYQFQQLQGSYTAITGGTLINTSFWDDENCVDINNPNGPTNQASGPGVPIGFNFNFGGNVFDRFGINHNGFIFLGQSSLGASAVNNNISGGSGSYYYQGLSYTGSSAPTALQNRIGAFVLDLFGQSGSNIRVEVLGSTPSSTLVVQWTNIQASGGSMNFQIRLAETTNVIEVIYGNSSFSWSDQAQVGLRGSAATTDFNMRQLSNPNPWSGSSPATSITNALSYNNTVKPASGQIYRWDPPPACTLLPAMNSIVATSTLVCPNYGVTFFNLATTYTNAGYTFSWQASSNAVGPFTNIPGGNGSTLTTPTITANTYIQLVAHCINAAGNMSTTPVLLEAAGVTTSVVPYFEDFEGILANDELPNCSWLAGNPGVTETFTAPTWGNRIARSGAKYASFYTTYTSGPNYFYSNGIQMEPGVTYSATVWYQTDFNTWNLNINDVSLSVGPNQSPTGLVTIASDLNPMGVQNYKALTGLFTVPASGLYYMAVGMDGMGSYGTEWLTWDDLEVTIPCSMNAPNMTVGSNVPSICTGQPLSLNAGGADLYEWFNGSTSASIVEIPASAGYMNYTVIGTSAASGCSITASIPVLVNASPVVLPYTTDPEICIGTAVNLIANGTAQSYTWTPSVTNPNSMVVSVSPNATTIYTVSGMDNTNGCITMAFVQVSVNPLPTINANSDAPANTICKGESLNLSATGGVSYQWSSNMATILTQIANVHPQTTTTYTLMGTNANGCVGKATIEVTVNECTGINQVSTTLSGVKVYPNPTAGIFTIELNNTSMKNVQVTDLSGRVIMTNSSNNETMNVNIENLANGIYYVKIQSDNGVDVIKIIKD